jgi:Rrf2 family protein
VLTEMQGKPISVRAAAERQDVPYAFARSIQHDLVRAGLISTLRGAQGGMVLEVDPGKLTLYELIEVVQGPVNVAICANDPNWCARHRGCPFHTVWQGANALLADYLSSVSIKDLIGGKKARLVEH